MVQPPTIRFSEVELTAVTTSFEPSKMRARPYFASVLDAHDAPLIVPVLALPVASAVVPPDPSSNPHACNETGAPIDNHQDGLRRPTRPRGCHGDGVSCGFREDDPVDSRRRESPATTPFAARVVLPSARSHIRGGERDV